MPDIPGGKRVDRDRMGACSSQRMVAGMSGAAPSVVMEGGAAVAVEERDAELQSEPRARASMRLLLTRAGERAQMGRTIQRVLSAHADPESRATGGCGRVVVCGVAPDVYALAGRGRLEPIYF